MSAYLTARSLDLVMESCIRDSLTGSGLAQVSIGMPVFNGEAFLVDALNDLTSQTFVNFELLISDNCSTDNTEAICREFASRDARISYFRQASNIGAIPNFQFVLDQAAGQYFMWAAADDKWSPNWVESLLSEAQAGSCLAYGRVQTIDRENQLTQHPANERRFDYSGNRLFRRIKYFLEPGILGKANPIYGIGATSELKLKGVSWIAAEGGRGDMIFLYELLGRMDIKPVSGAILYKRIHDGSAGTTDAANTLPRLGKRSGFRNFIGEMLRSPMIPSYLVQSSRIESVFLILAYPICVAWNAVYGLRAKISRW